MLVAAAAAAQAAPPGVAAVVGSNPRVAARSTGSDKAAARAIAARLLVHPWPAQLVHVRCERVGPHLDCGLVVSAVKFHRTLDRGSWNEEIGALVAGAYAAAPQADEIDCWATVPLDAGQGAVVSGDYAKPTAATVFSITVPRAGRAGVAERLASGQGVFWDPAFAASLAKGTRG
ncbi:MAG: hypothetical protein ABI186_00770 [Candidatus Elarobacter sp.]